MDEKPLKLTIKDLTRTNNNIEAWHKFLTHDLESHPNFYKLFKTLA